VQGVWFRGSTRQQALQLGIRGFARNLDDGSVEVVACGDKEAVSQLHTWLWQGPDGARVDNVVCVSDEGGVYLDFTTA